MRTPNRKGTFGLLFLVLVVPLCSCLLASQVATSGGLPALPAKGPDNSALQAEWPLAGEVIEGSAVVLLAESYVVPGLGNITAGTHATERHAEAQMARRALSNDAECHDCADGKTRCWTVGGFKGFFMAVYQIVKGVLVEVTAFTCDEAYLDDVLNDCDGTGGNAQPWW